MVVHQAGHFGDHFAFDVVDGLFGLREACEQIVVFGLIFAGEDVKRPQRPWVVARLAPVLYASQQLQRACGVFLGTCIAARVSLQFGAAVRGGDAIRVWRYRARIRERRWSTHRARWHRRT